MLFKDGKIYGVGHHERGGDDVREDEATMVFGNAAPQLVAAMLPQDWRAAFLLPYAKRPPSISLWTMSFGVNRLPREFGVRNDPTFVIPDWMHSLSQMREASALMAAAPSARGGRIPYYVLVDYSRIDSGLNESGPFVVSLCSGDRLDNWASLDAETVKGAQGRVDGLRHCRSLLAVSGLADAIVHREMATARDHAALPQHTGRCCLRLCAGRHARRYAQAGTAHRNQRPLAGVGLY